MSKATALVSRRTALGGAMALPFAGVMLGAARPVRAAAEMKGAGVSPYNRFSWAVLRSQPSWPEPELFPSRRPFLE